VNQYVLLAIEFALLLPAIIVHEVSHGWVAFLLGDPTAKQHGRLSLNPLKHIDPFGTILLPVLLLVASNGQAAFGYAKPVPINPYRFKNYRTGMFLTGIAGPASNVAMALGSGVIVRIFGLTSWVTLAVYYFALVNLVLLFFNLIPIPPLDGSRVLPLFLSDSGLRTYHQIERYGFIILLAILWGVPALFHVDPIGAYLGATVEKILPLLTGVR
jgi:Zn-dependent protease